MMVDKRTTDKSNLDRKFDADLDSPQFSNEDGKAIPKRSKLPNEDYDPKVAESNTNDEDDGGLGSADVLSR